MKILLQNRSRSGLTLLELAVVLAILSSLSGMVLFNLTTDRMKFAGAGQDKTAPQIATEATMMGIREAVMGSTAGPGYWDDVAHLATLWPFPNLYRLFQPLLSDPSLTIGSFGDYQALVKYNPYTRIGWRGPYMQPPNASYTVNTNKGFTTNYFFPAVNCPYFLDAWGNSIVLQFPETYKTTGLPLDNTNPAHNLYNIENCRMVSAGPNGALDTELNLRHIPNGMPGYDYLAANPSSRGDDIIMFFMKYPSFGPNSP
ncbi:MAG: type II secretion system protein [Pedosphaera sp.]|nr:type II secretion system protein [Pedosphaera sp.]